MTTPEPDGAMKRAQAHAVGIARDIADAFAAKHNDGSSSAALFRKLADELLTEPELVRAIAAWHRAGEQCVAAVAIALAEKVEGGRPEHTERARGLLKRHEALALRCTLSAHHEEWWRLHRDYERGEAELVALLADGMRARRREPGRLASPAHSEAAIDALREAEMPQAVPGRLRDLAERLSNFAPDSQMGGGWTIGMAVMLLLGVADGWKRLQEAGTNLSQEKRPAVHATPVLLEATAMWSGAQIGQADGAVHFTREAWQKFISGLSADPPLEILVHPLPPCGCRGGECESKPDHECRMTVEIREGGHQ